MQIQKLIVSTLPIFKVGDPVKKLLKFFKDGSFSHVAIVENKKFVGVLDENDLPTVASDQKIGDFRYNLETFFVRKDANWLDVIEVFARNEANLVPVLDEQEEVIGYYDLTTVISVFIDTPFFTEPGGIIVVAKGIKDYSFSEIAQIVESNNAKLIGAFITDMRSDVIQITLKVGTARLNEIIQTFRRYNYSILFGNQDDMFLEDLKQRSDYLDKYLNV